MNPYRCAIIGCGGRAHWHAKAYDLVSRGRLVACCDRIADRREAFATEFNIKPYSDAADMIRQERPDLIHIVTLPDARVDLVTLVHELGVTACIVEKPIALQVADWKALVDLEVQSPTKFGVGAQFRYHPDLTRCHEALSSGDLGDLLFLDCSARGTICDQGVHVIDWAMSLNKDQTVRQVFGTASGSENLSHPRHPSPDKTVAGLEFANGVHALWHLGHNAPRVLDDDAYYKHCRVAAYAERGRVLYEEFGRWEIVSTTGEESGYIADVDQWAAGNHAAQANLTNGMFDWIEDDGNPVGTDLKRSLQQWNVVLGLYASTVFNQPVDIPFDPPEDLWKKLGETLK
jgi:predicted dehydrogenase